VPQEEALRTYCIDTSSLVNLQHWRPLRNNPEPWRHLHELIEDRRLISPDEVLHEIQAVDDTLLRWARTHKKMFRRNSHDVVQKVQEILAKFQQLVDLNHPTGRNADPFVIALALKQQETEGFLAEVTVVTEEKYAPGRPRIPHVCEAYGLKYLTIHQTFLFEGWTF